MGMADFYLIIFKANAISLCSYYLIYYLVKFFIKDEDNLLLIRVRFSMFFVLLNVYLTAIFSGGMILTCIISAISYLLIDNLSNALFNILIDGADISEVFQYYKSIIFQSESTIIYLILFVLFSFLGYLSFFVSIQ